MELLVAVQVKLIDEGKALFGALRVRDGDRPVQLDNGRAGQESQLAVQRRDLRPVAWLLGMERCNGCLDHIWTAAVQREGTGKRLTTACNLRVVPARRVLVGKEDKLPVLESGVAATIVEQHQRVETMHLRLVWHQLAERVSEPDRLGCQVHSAAVPLVEDQIDDG